MLRRNAKWKYTHYIPLEQKPKRHQKKYTIILNISLLQGMIHAIVDLCWMDRDPL